MTDFRSLALALPEAVEQDHFGSPSFRVGGKIFAQLSADEDVGLVKLARPIQEAFVCSHPEDCWAEEQWGRYGWTRLRWRNLPSETVSDLLNQSWRAVAPRNVRLNHQERLG